jgi:hypothetical protein
MAKKDKPMTSWLMYNYKELVEIARLSGQKNWLDLGIRLHKILVEDIHV